MLLADQICEHQIHWRQHKSHSWHQLYQQQQLLSRWEGILIMANIAVCLVTGKGPLSTG